MYGDVDMYGRVEYVRGRRMCMFLYGDVDMYGRVEFIRGRRICMFLYRA
jgi:hypothetical protein